MLHIREMRAEEVPLLKDFAPREWNTDFSVTFGRHFGKPYFHPIIAELDGSIVGCANGLQQGVAGWLGNIVVLPEARGRGAGRALTEALMEFFRAKGIPFQILIATSMGEPVYRKLGFEIASQYIFFEREETAPCADNVPGVRALTAADEECVFELDRSVTGEIRTPFLRGFLEGAFVHAGSDGSVDGYCLPSLGNGPVIASNDTAGLALMQHKLNQGAKWPVVPEQNKVAVDFLRSKGFVETSRAPRMTLGPDIGWQPERVYCRGSGYCG